ncbi:hypothetical protein [Methylobacterium haplocladii]|uniref:hypothetical protein n=1 Tax=Methylobacterium haplocladii TaxID=1176176 RepID=UPI0011BF3F88|nr:hypothetical protein [Methylobacterium haplocladii]
MRRSDGSGVGFRLFCSGCNSAKQKAYRAAHPGFSTTKNRRWQCANPEKRRAHQAVCRALRSGTLTKGPCATCGTTKRVEAHHEDYARPLVVTWFCRRHHLARHREIAAETAAATHQKLYRETRGSAHV